MYNVNRQCLYCNACIHFLKLDGIIAKHVEAIELIQDFNITKGLVSLDGHMTMISALVCPATNSLL